MRELGRGAEAIVTLDGTLVRKERPKKTYRHPGLDAKLRKRRTRKEAKVLKEAAAFGIPVPMMRNVDDEHGVLNMTFVKGEKFRDVIKDHVSSCEGIGTCLATLHDHDIMHGDLTTSNLIFSKRKLYFIDFGLSFHSNKIEDRAVDLHLFKQALQSKHHMIASAAWDAFLEGYSPKNKDDVLKRLSLVEQRGRNKHG